MDSPSPSPSVIDVTEAIRRAEECLELEPPPRAARILEELKALFPWEGRLWHLRGRAAEDLGRTAEAEEHYRMALRLERESLLPEGLLPESLVPESLDCALDLAELLVDDGREVEGAALAEGLARSRPDLARPHAVLGHARIAEGRPAEAEVALRRALALQPDLCWAGRELASILCSRGDLAEAADVLRGLLAGSPDDALTLACLGCVERRRGDEGAAESCFRKALLLDFEVEGAFRGLYDLLLRTSRAVEARDLLAEGLRRFTPAPVEAEAGRW